VKDFCPALLPGAPGDGRQTSINIKRGQILFPGIFFDLSVINGNFLHPRMQRASFLFIYLFIYFVCDKEIEMKRIKFYFLSSSMYWYNKRVITQADFLSKDKGASLQI